MKFINPLIICALLFLSFGCLLDQEDEPPKTDDPPANNTPDSRLLKATVMDFNASFEGQGEKVTWDKTGVSALVGCNQFAKGHTLELKMPNDSFLNWHLRTDEPGQFKYVGNEQDMDVRMLANPTTTTFIPVKVEEGYYTRLVVGTWTITRVPTVKGEDDKYIYQSAFEGTFRDVNPPERAINVQFDWMIEYSKSPTHCQE